METYQSARSRMLELARGLDAESAARTVPACPEWTCHDLVVHVASMPIAIATGDIPGDDPEGWVSRVLDERRGWSVDDLDQGWRGADEILAAIIDGPGLLLYYDLVVHEQDLRGAVGRPGGRTESEVATTVEISLGQIHPNLVAAGLPPLAVRDGDTTLNSGEGDPGCTLLTTVWEASRALNGRRTADELRALPREGHLESYLDPIGARFQLLAESLAEV